jgi:hypothetical protein
LLQNATTYYEGIGMTDLTTILQKLKDDGFSWVRVFSTESIFVFKESSRRYYWIHLVNDSWQYQCIDGIPVTFSLDKFIERGIKYMARFYADNE